MAIFRGPILNPQSSEQCDYYRDGALAVNDAGSIVAIGHFDQVVKTARGQVIELANSVITPAFTDVHVHAPQNHVKGQFGGQELLQWLRECIWPAEGKFNDPDFADAKARDFYREMAGQGTLLSLVFSTIHEHALHSLFRHQIGRTIAGNVLMDQESPDYLLQDTKQAVGLTQRMAQEYGHRYAVTPRFAPTCSMELMQAVAAFADRFGTWIQTHLSENTDEVAWVKELFPDAASYTDVYRLAGLLGPRTVMAHAIHLSDDELRLLKKTGTKVAHCPTSNEELLSGRMPVKRIKAAGVPFALASDVGAGPSLSMLHVMQAYLRVHRGHAEVTPEEALYRATLAGAEILDMAGQTGNLAPGKEANVVFLTTSATPRNAAEAIEDLTHGSQVNLEAKPQAVYFQGRKVA